MSPTNKRTADLSNNFDPEKCLVIYDTNNSMLPSLNQDTIRIAICKEFGPTIIDHITPYNWNISKPKQCKFMVQIPDDRQRKTILENWKEQLFSSKIRCTIKPPQHIGVVRGVPLNVTDDDILHDINENFRAVSVFRFKNKDSKPLLTVKVQFHIRS
jgi:hypothetical protein